LRILGVDPALTRTGYGIIDADDTRYSLVKAGIIQTSSKNSAPQRFLKIFDTISTIIANTKPDVMVLEKVFVHYHHPTTAFLLGQARGIICLSCARANIPLVEYSATRVKKSIVGQGHALKSQVQRMVVALLNLGTIPKYNDVTDALALAIAYTHMHKADERRMLFHNSLQSR